MKPLGEHPGGKAAGQDPARANPQRDLTATEALHLAAQRMSEEEREALIDRLVPLVHAAIVGAGAGWTPEYERVVVADLLSTLLPGGLE